MQRLIYVADADADVRQSIRDFLVRCDPEWQVTGFNGLGSLLGACRSETPDAVLVDLRLPGAGAGELLEEVRTVAPLAMRVIMAVPLGGNASFRLSGAHQYLCKPFLFSELYHKMRRVFQAQNRLENRVVRERILSLRSLPSLPGTYYAIVTGLQESQGDLAPVVELLARDSGLSTTLLRLANSPLFGTHMVSDLLEAVMVLGTERIKAIVVSQEVFKQYAKVEEPVRAQALWNHSCQTAALAKRFCERSRLRSTATDTAFLGALLHNTGRLILLENFRGSYRTALLARGTQATLAQIEKEALHVSGEEVSGFVLDLWGLAEEVVSAAAYHEHPWDEPDASQFTPATAIYLANYFAHRLSPPDPALAPALDEEYVKRISPPTLGTVEELLELAKVELAEQPMMVV